MGWEELDDPFLKERLNHPLLGASEERKLLRQAQSKNRAQRKKAREKLVQCNQKLVFQIAKRFLGRGLSLLDLMQEGSRGLERTIEEFDLKRDSRLSTYAHWWIMNTIHRAVMNQGNLIRIPVHQSERRQEIAKVSGRIRQARGGDNIPVSELSTEMGLSERQIRSTLDLPTVVSLDEPINQSPDGEEADTLGAFLPDPEQDVEARVLEGISAEQRTRVLERAFRAANLTEREKEVLDLRFGLTSQEPMILQKIADQLGVSRQRIEQLQSKALRKMREPHVQRMLRKLR